MESGMESLVMKPAQYMSDCEAPTVRPRLVVITRSDREAWLAAGGGDGGACCAARDTAPANTRIADFIFPPEFLRQQPRNILRARHQAGTRPPLRRTLAKGMGGVKAELLTGGIPSR